MNTSYMLVVNAHVQVQSIAKRGIVNKLNYRTKGPFIITADLDHNRRYEDPLSVKRKYKIQSYIY